MQPWRTIDSVETAEGRLDLRQRGDRSFLITIAGRVLMTSEAHRSETDLAKLARAAMGDLPRPHVLIGGLGMGYTLRAALDCLPPGAKITVAELNPAVVAWCAGPLAALTNGATSDRRVTTVVADVARVIADAAPGSYDAIVLDLYEGPHQATGRAHDPFYGFEAMRRTARALTPDG
ncbi:MAG TPA: spermidine synthase, partial [Polyangia bacterium]|nr:spermidine synthase [Polyangia bacterium]